MKLIKVVALVKTCGEFPAQWAGLTDKGLYVYVRCRYGNLRVSVGFNPIDEDRDAVYVEVGGGRGDMTLEELREATAGQIEWPSKELGTS